MGSGLHSCRGCDVLFRDGDLHLLLCNECLNRLAQSAKMRSLVLQKELKRIRDRHFTDEEISAYLAHILEKKSAGILEEKKKSILSRKEAQSLFLKRYYSGEACANGHFSERFTCNNRCVRCSLDKGIRFRERKAIGRPMGRPGWISMKSPDEREKIKEAILAGIGTSEIAKTYGCHRNTVINLKRTMHS